jgi:uncharacterized protein YbjT (DUF2867 family)
VQQREVTTMRYRKTTIFLGLLLALVLWLLISGIEGERADAGLAPVSSQPGSGAVMVLGGTRGTGLEVVKILRARGEEVAVLARPSSDPAEAQALGARIVRGDALNPADVSAALATAQFRAVISALGGRRGDARRPDFEGNRNAVDAAKAAGIRRFILVTAIGASESSEASPWITKVLFKDVAAEKRAAEQYLRASGLDYTIIRPGGLLRKEAQGRAYLTEDDRAFSWIRRTDLARLVVQALDDPKAIGESYHAFDPDRTRFWAIPLN